MSQILHDIAVISFACMVQLKDTDVFAGTVIDFGWPVNTPKENESVKAIN